MPPLPRHCKKPTVVVPWCATTVCFRLEGRLGISRRCPRATHCPSCILGQHVAVHTTVARRHAGEPVGRPAKASVAGIVEHTRVPAEERLEVSGHAVPLHM